MRPDLSRVVPYFHGYINLVPEDELAEAFVSQSASFIRFLETIPPEKYDFRYAENKWTIQEVVQHVLDAERIFAYRALRFARLDLTPLPGFDENSYVISSNAHHRPWDKLVEEFKVLRRSSELLFQSFTEEQLQAGGTASNGPNYVLGLGFILIGHAMHHLQVVKERYL
jgi:hypothetical protein